jgi:pimeloyl-ACP methyl ester carboxylesterase
MSTNPVWEGHPASYLSYLEAFAARFRVIVPDVRGCGRTLNPGGGSISYAQLADDIIAFSTALRLDRPILCGFSDGGTIATVAAVRSPRAFAALVNDAGFDMLNPESRTFAMGRQVFGGSPQATKANPEAAASALSAHGMADFVRCLQADHQGQGPGGWTATLAQAFERMTSHSGTTVDDLRKVAAPTLILSGDRDMLCSVEEAVTAYRVLTAGELAIVPGLAHGLSKAAIELTIDFLERHAR